MKKDPESIRKEFLARQNRQIVAIAIALFVVLLCAVLYKRPDLFGSLSKQSLFVVQALSIGAFLGFSAYNWRCPSCGKFLGPDLHQQTCRKCGARLR